MYFNWANGTVNLHSWLENNSDNAQVLKDIKKQYNIGAIPTAGTLQLGLLRAVLTAVKAFLGEEGKTMDKLKGYLPLYPSMKGVLHTGAMPEKKKGTSTESKPPAEEDVV